VRGRVPKIRKLGWHTSPAKRGQKQGAAGAPAALPSSALSFVDQSLCAADDEERPFVCEECQAAFKRACELGNHKRGHAREKLLSKG